MDKKQREARRHQEDKALNRGLMWVVGAVLLECLMLLVNRYYINFRVSEVETAILFYNALSAARIIGGLGGLLCLGWGVLRLRRGAGVSLPAVLTLVCWALALCGYVSVKYGKDGVQMLFLLVPAWAGLALVYYLYQREFFLSAAASGAAAVGLWFIRFSGMGVEAALCAVLVVLTAAAAVMLKKSGGVIKSGGEDIQFISKNAAYTVVLVSCVISAAAMAAAVLLGGGAAYYLIFAMAAWIFALLVYYTVKLM